LNKKWCVPGYSRLKICHDPELVYLFPVQ